MSFIFAYLKKFACNVLKLCLNLKRDIAELFPDTTVFFDEKTYDAR